MTRKGNFDLVTAVLHLLPGFAIPTLTSKTPRHQLPKFQRAKWVCFLLQVFTNCAGRNIQDSAAASHGHLDFERHGARRHPFAGR